VAEFFLFLYVTPRAVPSTMAAADLPSLKRMREHEADQAAQIAQMVAIQTEMDETRARMAPLHDECIMAEKVRKVDAGADISKTEFWHDTPELLAAKRALDEVDARIVRAFTKTSLFGVFILRTIAAMEGCGMRSKHTMLHGWHPDTWIQDIQLVIKHKTEELRKLRLNIDACNKRLSMARRDLSDDEIRAVVHKAWDDYETQTGGDFARRKQNCSDTVDAYTKARDSKIAEWTMTDADYNAALAELRELEEVHDKYSMGRRCHECKRVMTYSEVERYDNYCSRCPEDRY